MQSKLKKQYMIELGFRNKDNQIKYLQIKPDDTTLASVWTKQLDHLLFTHSNKIFQKNFSLLGFHNDNRTREHICNDLDRSIQTINYYKAYRITEDFSSLRCEYNQDLLNVLHHHFEITQGQLWKPGTVLANANGETRNAISMLNHCCHELEAWYETEKNRPTWTNGYFYYNVLGVTDRIEIPLEEKRNFTRDITDGLVYLHYAQTGKTWYEAYLDNDSVVGADGISEHRVISGEFNCYFGTGYELPMDDNFTKWLEAKGVDPNNEQLALGYAPVGKIINMPHTEAVDFFKEYTDFYSIEFNKKRIEYDYRHTDLGYFPMLERMWSKWNG
jgi:hypothetical protein